MTNAAAEAEGDAVTELETGLVPSRAVGSAPIDRWIEGDMDKALERINTRVKMLEALRVASISATQPTDWIVHTTNDEQGNAVRSVCYLQDSGAQRAAKIWGIEIGQPAIEFEKFDDGTFCYHMIAEAWSKVTGERLEYVEGSRWSGDKFFQNQVKREGDRIDPVDVRKSAYSNLEGRAVRILSGLNGVQLEVLVKAGLDTKKCVHITYGGGSSALGVGTAELTIRWGNSKGKKLPDLDDKDLAYYLKAEEKNLEDPAKERFRKQTQVMVDALRAETERRKKGTEQAAETGNAAPQTRGQKLSALKARLDAALGKGNAVFFAAFVRALSGEIGTEVESISDLSDEQIAKISEISDETLKGAADHVAKVQKK